MTTSQKKPLPSKLVYIHELDSVRNSDAEIERARKCLYDEILINGNTPVISFNQLADSRAFLGLITESLRKAHAKGQDAAGSKNASTDEERANADETSRKSLDNMQDLMKSGRIRIVRFGEKRTASQYLQENLNPYMAKEEDEFVLSGWPLPHDLSDDERSGLLESIWLALKNSDPDYLDRHSKDKASRVKAGFAREEIANPSLEKDEIELLKQLVEFMLFISKTEFAYADINPIKPEFEDVLKLVLDRIESGEISVSESKGEDALRAARDNLMGLWSDIKADPSAKPHKRSAWHRALRKQLDTSLAVRELSFAIVDLCYNLVIESGIDRCSHFFNPAGGIESVNAALSEKLSEYMADYKEFEHTYEDGAQCDLDDKGTRENDGLDWDLAVNIQHALNRRFASTSIASDCESHEAETYGSNLWEQRAEWRRNVYGALRFQTLGALLYVVLFAFIEVVLSLIDNLVEGAGKTALVSDAPGIEDMFTFNRTVAISVIFVIGVVAYVLLTQKDRSHNVKVPIIGVSVIFFVVMPVLACIEIVPAANGMPSIEFELADFIDNFVAMLPSLLVGLVAVIAFAWIGSILEERTGVPALFDSMRLTKDSVIDAWKFWSLTKRREDAEPGVDSGMSEVTAESSCSKIYPDSWATLFPKLGADREADSPKGPWGKYVALVEGHDGDSADDSLLSIIRDENKANSYASEMKRPLGIIYDSPYNTLVVDLVRDKDGKEFAYERLIPKADSGVVIVPRHDGKFVLLDQFRHAIRGRQLAFPRGFGEEGLRPAENACKELSEELNLATPIEESDMIFLGRLTPDSGISANIVSVFWCEIGNYSITEGNEGILDVCEMSEDELRAAIARGVTSGGDDANSESTPNRDGNSADTGASTDDSMGAHAAGAIEVDSTEAHSAGTGIITDGFTLAAFAMWECGEGKVRKKRRCRCPRRFLRQKP